MPSNRFFVKNVKYLLLTYAQAGENFNYEAIVDLCVELRAECIIGRELHSTGGTHYHAFLEFESPFSTRNARRFDIDGRHPNVAQVGHTPWVAYDYAIKDGDIVAGGAARPGEGGVQHDRRRDDNGDWGWILSAESRDEYFVRLRERAPRALACNFPSLCKYADWRWKHTAAKYSSPQGLQFEGENMSPLLDWVDDNTRGGIER